MLSCFYGGRNIPVFLLLQPEGGAPTQEGIPDIQNTEYIVFLFFKSVYDIALKSIR